MKKPFARGKGPPPPSPPRLPTPPSFRSFFLVLFLHLSPSFSSFPFFFLSVSLSLPLLFLVFIPLSPLFSSLSFTFFVSLLLPAFSFPFSSFKPPFCPHLTAPPPFLRFFFLSGRALSKGVWLHLCGFVAKLLSLVPLLQSELKGCDLSWSTQKRQHNHQKREEIE